MRSATIGESRNTSRPSIAAVTVSLRASMPRCQYRTRNARLFFQVHNGARSSWPARRTQSPPCSSPSSLHCSASGPSNGALTRLPCPVPSSRRVARQAVVDAGGDRDRVRVQQSRTVSLRWPVASVPDVGLARRADAGVRRDPPDDRRRHLGDRSAHRTRRPLVRTWSMRPGRGFRPMADRSPTCRTISGRWEVYVQSLSGRPRGARVVDTAAPGRRGRPTARRFTSVRDPTAPRRAPRRPRLVFGARLARSGRS